MAWLAALAILWLEARTEARLPSSRPRPPVGPPLSPGTERVALAAVLVVALAFRFLLLAQVPPFISNDEFMFSFETG
jgi:hypothetical protein